MTYSLHFEPLFSPAVLWILGIPAFILLAAALLLRRRGTGLRLLACAFFAIALLNPVVLKELREPLKSIVAIVVDNSQSQNFGARQADTATALAKLRQELKAYPQFEPRIAESAKQTEDTDNPGNMETRLFTPLRDALADAPPSRIGGAILLTDGQIADIPSVKAGDSAAALDNALGFHAPVNALISGYPRDYDRRIHFIAAPRFGIAGKPLDFSFTVQNEGAMPDPAAPAQVQLFVNGKEQADWTVPPNAEIKREITLPHVGHNIIELRTPPLKGELTDMNNRAALIIDGVRENLKVLLVSGEPHNGLRTWRDLLKSDTGVDLVHFTILRPPEKADNTPLSQLSLIVFPTTELFVNKLKDFDLVIFDRYQHYDVLPLAYYEYMARYVENGGALLIAAGPEYAGGRSLALTPLSRILPARPTGNIFEKPFLPALTEVGKRHPVTRDLEGGNQNNANPPKWGRWLRQIEAEAAPGSEALMEGVNHAPLLVLAHEGQGRVGMLLSDEGWLWARNYEGGGPYASLYRRMAHWLMKEPDLEEESLTATAKGHEIFITRRTMADLPQPASGNRMARKTAGGNAGNNSPIGIFHIILPSGKTVNITPQKQADGIYTAAYASPETGLVRIENGDKSALVHVGAADIPEFADIIATADKLAPIAAATGGHILRMHPSDSRQVQIGGIKVIKAGEHIVGHAGDIILRQSNDTRLKAETRIPLFSDFWALALGLALLALAWWRESRD